MPYLRLKSELAHRGGVEANMIKKVSTILIIAVIVCAFSIPVFAGVDSSIYNPDTSTTDQFMVTITRPDGDESTFNQSYVICGVTGQEGVTVKALIEKDGWYSDFPDTDGVTSWTIGSSGVFMKEVTFPNTGANKLRIVAYTDSQRQINDFTITVLEQSLKDKIQQGLMTIKDMFKQLN